MFHLFAGHLARMTRLCSLLMLFRGGGAPPDTTGPTLVFMLVGR